MSEEHYLVVGGSKGMGLGLVHRLTAAGHHVTVWSRSAESLSGLPHVTHHNYDASLGEIRPEMIPPVLHGVAYCPGTLNLRPFRNLSLDTFRSDFQINVVGAVQTVQSCLEAMKAAGKSSVLLFSTVAVAQGMYAHASIAASKGAIEGLTRSLAAELSPAIRVNCIAPALTRTNLTEKFFIDPAKAALLSEKYPLGRTGTADDLAAMGQFLLSPQSSWITGQIIGVDGGLAAVRK